MGHISNARLANGLNIQNLGNGVSLTDAENKGQKLPLPQRKIWRRPEVVTSKAGDTATAPSNFGEASASAASKASFHS